MKSPLIRLLVAVFIASLLFLGTGCISSSSYQHVYSARQAEDGKWYRPNGQITAPTPAVVDVENNTEKPIRIFSRLANTLVVINPHEFKPVFVDLFYYDYGDIHLFAQPVQEDLTGTRIAHGCFRFGNYRANNGFDAPSHETRIWTIGPGDFKGEREWRVWRGWFDRR